jgi:hypothetical protein
MRACRHVLFAFVRRRAFRRIVPHLRLPVHPPGGATVGHDATGTVHLHLGSVRVDADLRGPVHARYGLCRHPDDRVPLCIGRRLRRRSADRRQTPAHRGARGDYAALVVLQRSDGFCDRGVRVRFDPAPRLAIRDRGDGIGSRRDSIFGVGFCRARDGRNRDRLVTVFCVPRDPVVRRRQPHGADHCFVFGSRRSRHREDLLRLERQHHQNRQRAERHEHLERNAGQ